MSERTKVIVDIYGKNYTVIGEEHAAHIRKVAEIVDEKMKGIFKKNPNLDVTSLAVLTAVNTVNDYIKTKEEMEELRRKIKEE